MKKLIALVCVAVLAVSMYATKPEKKEHKAAMMNAIREFVDEEADNRLGDNILSDLGQVFANNSIKIALGAKLKLHDYLLFNTTTMHLDGQDQLMSVGILGHVFTFDKEMLSERLNKAEQAAR